MTHPIPPFYRLVLNLIEPLLALGGAVQLLFFPDSYLRLVSPRATYHETLDPLMTQIVGGWFIIIWIELYVLPRHFSHVDGDARTRAADVSAWRVIMAGILLSDAAYLFAIYQDWGLVKMILWWMWDWKEATTMILTILPVTARAGLVAGIGIQTRSESSRKD